MSGRRRATARPTLQPPSIDALEPADAAPSPDDRYEHLRFTRADWTGAYAEHIEIDACELSDTRLTEARLPSARIADARFDACDATNAEAEDSSLLRVALTNSKLLGLHLGGASLRHVRFADCNLMLSSFRFAKLWRVSFVDCDLRQATFQGCELTHCEFAGCDLREAQFSHSAHDGTDLRGSRLEGLRGLEALGGAVIDGNQLIDLAPQLAASIGLRVADPSEEEA